MDRIDELLSVCSFARSLSMIGVRDGAGRLPYSHSFGIRMLTNLIVVRLCMWLRPYTLRPSTVQAAGLSGMATGYAIRTV